MYTWSLTGFITYALKDLYIAHNTLPIPQLHIQQLLLLVHKCIYHKSMLPQIFLDYFHENQTIYSHHTRQKNNLHLYSVHSIFGQMSFKFHGASLWNELPKYLKDIQSVKNLRNC